MKVFVLHYTKMTERKKNILMQFERYGIKDFEFIELYDKDTLSSEDKAIFVDNFSTVKISLIKKHIHVYNIISSSHDQALILEDDAILCDDFLNKFNDYLKQVPSDYDMVFLGNGCNLHIEKHRIVSGNYIYKKCLYPTSWGGDGATRCTDSYIISNKCASKLCEYILNLKNKINTNIDWWLNIAARDNNLNVYWAEPTIVKQGSQNGLYAPTVY